MHSIATRTDFIFTLYCLWLRKFALTILYGLLTGSKCGLIPSPHAAMPGNETRRCLTLDLDGKVKLCVYYYT